MNITYEVWDGEPLTQTHGGEHEDDSIKIAEYGFSIGGLSIYDIPPETFKGLAVEMINHLIVNGHQFELNKDHSDYHYSLKAK